MIVILDGRTTVAVFSINVIVGSHLFLLLGAAIEITLGARE